MSGGQFPPGAGRYILAAALMAVAVIVAAYGLWGTR